MARRRKQPQTKTVTGYARVSTEEQATDGVSLDAQRAKIEAYCFANDLELAGMFVDEGLSGSRTDNRPALQQALDTVCAGAGVLVVYSLSRLARSTKDTLELSERLDKSGADLVSLSEKIDTTSAAGKMIFKMLAVLNEFESDLIKERTTMAMAHKRDNGERISRHIPFGQRLSADGVHLEDDPQEQTTISRVMEFWHQGFSQRKVARYLEAEGFLSRTGKRLNHSTIGAIVATAV